MKLPSDTPRLPKWPFLLGWAGLVFTAWVIWYFAARPITGVALVSVVACVNVAAVVVVIPFITDYFAASEEAMDNRQRSLQALSVTISSAAEQVSIAATGLQGIAEAAQDNYSKFEQLSKTVEARIAEMESRLASVVKDDGEAAAKYEAAAKKVAKAAADFESGAAKAASASEAARSAAADFEAAVAKAAAASRAAPLKAAEPAHAELPPVPADRIAEVRPAVRKSDHPFDEEPAEPAKPEDTPVISRAAAALSEAPRESAPTQAPAEPAPPAAEPAAAPPPPPRRRAPRKPQPAPAPAAPEELTLEPQPQPEAPAASEPAVSADGATRLVITAYIGIGNRLFIRGDGPGLSWEKGVPLSFVSIGKWRWETNDASGAVRFKLYKNDEAECTSLGERSIAPGAQQELTASF